MDQKQEGKCVGTAVWCWNVCTCVFQWSV